MKQSLIAAGIIIFIAGCSENKAESRINTGNTIGAYRRKLGIVEKGPLSSIMKLPGQLTAFEEVSIFPKVNGYVKQVLVDIGSKVSKGDLLMVLEAPEIEQATVAAREKYERAKADFMSQKERFSRLRTASATEGAISPMDLATTRLKMEADSAVCNAELANWQMQQTMLGYLRVTSPFNGIITERNVHPGALVNASAKDKPMLDLKQIEHLRLQVDVPENIAINMKLNDSIAFIVSSLPGKRMAGLVSRKSGNIDPRYRSERIEIDVPNSNGLLASGMYADIIFNAGANNSTLYVPRQSVITSTERKYIVTFNSGKAKKVDISTGIMTPDNIEIFGPVQQGDTIIINGGEEPDR